MQFPAKVSLYCPLLDAKGTASTLIAVTQDGYYHLEIPIKGRTHTLFVPVQHAALLFSEPEPEVEPGLEIER